MKAKRGDTRIMARWCFQLGIDPDTGDASLEFHQYDMAGPFETVHEALTHANERDVFGEGSAVIERYEYVGYGLYEWEEVEWFDAYGNRS